MKTVVSLALASALAVMSFPGLALADSKGLVAYSQAGMENEWRVMNTKEMEKAFKDAGYDDPTKYFNRIEGEK